jgi:predicted ATPase
MADRIPHRWSTRADKLAWTTAHPDECPPWFNSDERESWHRTHGEEVINIEQWRMALPVWIRDQLEALESRIAQLEHRLSEAERRSR